METEPLVGEVQHPHGEDVDGPHGPTTDVKGEGPVNEEPSGRGRGYRA